VILAEPAVYLECRFTRAQKLRVIRERLNRLIGRTYDPCGGVDPDRRGQLRARLDRVDRHLLNLTGEIL